MRVNVIKHLALDGLILLPVAEDLPYIARPFTKEELVADATLATLLLDKDRVSLLVAVAGGVRL